MMSQFTGAIMTEGGKMGSGECSWKGGSWRLERASALLFLLPGRYVTVNWNLEKNNDHLA